MTSLNKLVEMDHEVGKSNSPPKMISVNDYYWWKDRFEEWARFYNLRIWICICDGYSKPTQTVDARSVTIFFKDMNEEEKLVY